MAQDDHVTAGAWAALSLKMCLLQFFSIYAERSRSFTHRMSVLAPFYQLCLKEKHLNVAVSFTVTSLPSSREGHRRYLQIGH